MGWPDVVEQLLSAPQDVRVAALLVIAVGIALPMLLSRVTSAARRKLPATFQRHLRNTFGTPDVETGGVGTVTARSGARSGHGGGTPHLDAGGVDTPSIARTRGGHAIPRGRVPLHSQTGSMQPSTNSAADDGVSACYPVTAGVLAFRNRSGNVPGGGRRDGFQTSALQVRPRALPDTAAASRGHDGGTVVAPDTFGPTAHKSVSSLLILLDCCCARPSWTAP
jgi:hypothetical protein